MFGESSPSSCSRKIVANQQTLGDCNTTNATNFCIRTVGLDQGSDAIAYVDFNAADSPVTLCDNLDANGGLEIDLNYTFAIAGVQNGSYVDAITFTADTVGVDTNSCENTDG